MYENLPQTAHDVSSPVKPTNCQTVSHFPTEVFKLSDSRSSNLNSTIFPSNLDIFNRAADRRCWVQNTASDFLNIIRSAMVKSGKIENELGIIWESTPKVTGRMKELLCKSLR